MHIYVNITFYLSTKSKKMTDEYFQAFKNFYIVLETATISQKPAYSYISIDRTYIGYCDDFGPMNLSSVCHFCKNVEKELKQNENRKTAIQTGTDRRDITNAVFLVGSYMIMNLGADPESVQDAFHPIRDKLVSYRDVSPGPQNFELYLIDCWRGLWRAKNLSWVDFDAQAGRFDVDEYDHLDSPLNADLHEVVPGKFIAMRGPRSISSGAAWEDTYTCSGDFSHRDFSPSHYAGILEQFDVRAVIRLNTPEYEKSELRAAGIAVADLFFEDCTPPPVEVVAKFLLLAEHVPGALAVHCKAGLGRTGTLIALYMMKHHGFSAREAMGWLRIVRPGSVIGPQQQFLCEREATMRREAGRSRRQGPGGGSTADAAATAVPRTTAGLTAVEGVIAEIETEINRRAARAAALMSRSYVPRGPAPAASDELAAHVTAAAERRSGQRAAASRRGSGEERRLGTIMAAPAPIFNG